MTTFECFTIWLQAGGLLVACGGLFGLWLYVKKTTDIAKASELQSEILSQPAITVKIESLPPESYRGTVLRQFEHVGVVVENHSTVHAKIKIELKYRLRVGNSNHFESFSSVGNYGGEDVWNFAAKAKFFGHLTLTDLIDRDITPSDDLILDITVKSSPFNTDEYQANPPIQYRWKHIVAKWVPYPVPMA